MSAIAVVIGEFKKVWRDGVQYIAVNFQDTLGNGVDGDPQPGPQFNPPDTDAAPTTTSAAPTTADQASDGDSQGLMFSSVFAGGVGLLVLIATVLLFTVKRNCNRRAS